MANPQAKQQSYEPAYYFEDLKVGMTYELSKTVTDADIRGFAEISGDKNPVHLNEEYAKASMWKGRIAHGLMSSGLFSAIFGMYLPGTGTIYVNQSLRFKAPVRLGDTVTAKVELKELKPEKKRAIFTTKCYVGDTIVIDGEGEVLVPSRV